MKRKKYTKEFKDQAVKLSDTISVTEVARELGINENMLWKWKKELKVNPENAFTGKGTPEQEEIKRLKKELYEVTMQREILKKDITIFSK